MKKTLNIVLAITLLSLGLRVYALEPLDTYYTQQRYHTIIRSPQAWNIIHESPSVVVAIIDAGVDIDHPDLKQNIWKNPNEIEGNGIDDDGNGFIDDVYGWDFTNDSPDPRPKFEEGYIDFAMHHGTVVAGIIGAVGANQFGIAGVSWKVKLMPLRVIDATGVGDTIAIARAINYATNNGADIINLSFAGDDYSETLATEIERAYKNNILIVAAAGNKNINLDTTPQYPVCHKGKRGEQWIIGVGALDDNGRKAPFSNYGSSCVSVAAPGNNIFSTQFTQKRNNGFNTAYGSGWVGTSVSAPQVTGAAALIKARNPRITLGQWQQSLKDSATKIEANNPEYQGQLGGGLLNIERALTTVLKPHTPITRNGLLTGAGPSGGPHVRMFDRAGNVLLQFFAYDENETQGINVASGDIDGDFKEEIITVPATQKKPEVRIFSNTGTFIYKFLAYDEALLKGLHVAVADVNGDGKNEIITAPREGGSPHIRIFSGSGTLLSEFFAFNPTIPSGVVIAAGDVDNDGLAEIVAMPDRPSLSLVRVYSFEGIRKQEFYAFEPYIISSFAIAAGKGTIAVSTGPNREPTVKLFNTVGSMRAEWNAYDKQFKGGVHVAIGDVNGDGTDEIITGPRSGGGPHVKIFDSAGILMTQWMAYNPAFRGGISINTIK